MSRICSSTVGSFPLTYSERNVLRVLEDLEEVGIDYPATPQLRGFIEIFLDPLVDEGFLARGSSGEYYVVKQEFESLEPPIDWFREYVIAPRFKEGFEGLRLSITGPLTLASRIAPGSGSEHGILNSMLSNKKFTLEFMGSYVSRVVEKISSLGYSVTVVDEPVLSIIVGRRRILFNYSVEELTMLIDMVLGKSTSRIRGIHVCGRIPPLLTKILLSTSEASLLDHEYCDTPENYEAYSLEELESYNKYVSVGVVSSRRPEVESVKEVYDNIVRAWEKYGSRLFFVKPDCGFMALRGFYGDEEREYMVSIRKLKVIVEALKLFEQDFLER